MRFQSFHNIARSLAAAASGLALAATAGAQSAPATIDACFVPASGTLYRIDTPASPAPGAPKTCLSPLHTKLTWNQQGHAGPAGAPGAAGPIGPSGPTGAAGPVGLSGNEGAAGPAGSPGVAGPAGPTGNTGPVGATGPAGPQGAAGSAGLTGSTGAVGATGLAGPPGPQGQQGQQGPQGPSGGSNAKALFQGQTGTAGPSGRQVNVVASCPASQFALGGGVLVQAVSGGPPVLLQSTPAIDITSGRPTGWRVVMNVGPGPYDIRAQVICAP